MIEQEAHAQWNGSIKQGSGTFRAGEIESPYSFASRFGDGAGGTPEELLGAAEASCFSMALSLKLGQAGHEPERIDTTAKVTLDTDEKRITTIALTTECKVPGLDDEAELRRIAEEAKSGCIVSQALAGPEISLASVRLVS